MGKTLASNDQILAADHNRRVMHGLAANKPDATDVIAGSLYYETDTGILEQEQDNQWVSLIQTQPPFEDSGFTAGEAISLKAAVYISGANQVRKASAANAAKAIGYAKAAVLLNEAITVIWGGRITGVVADAAISPGDLVTPSDAIAGRVKSLSTISGAGSTHTHSGSAASASGGTPSGTIGAETAHTHPIGGETGAEATHTHTQGVTGGPSALVTLIGISLLTNAYCALTSGGSPTTSFHAIVTYGSHVFSTPTHTHTNPTTAAGSSHSHTLPANTGKGAIHNHTFTGSALAGHTHTITVGSEAAHTHATAVGKALGRALTAAAGEGDTIAVLLGGM